MGMHIGSELLYAIYGYMTHDYVMIASTGLPLISDCIQLKLYMLYKISHIPRSEDCALDNRLAAA